MSVHSYVSHHAKFKTGVGREVMVGEWPGDLDRRVAAWELWLR